MRLVLLLATSLLLASCDKEPVPVATVDRVTGPAALVRKDSAVPLAKGDTIFEGDRIRTGESVVVLKFLEDKALGELQKNADFIVSKWGKEKKLDVAKGNLWLTVKKLEAGEKFAIKTPSAMAGIRGTSLFFFHWKDLDGVCFCEGEVEYASPGRPVTKEHTDVVSFSRGGKTVDIRADEVPGVAWLHNHSAITGSLMGKPDSLTKEDREKILAYVEKKFAAGK